MNKTIANPIYYYCRSDTEPGTVFASFDVMKETETLDYIGKRHLFADKYYSVPWRYDQLPYFFDDKVAAGCVAACKGGKVFEHEVASPLTGLFLMDWAYDKPTSGGNPRYGDIVLADEEGAMSLTFKRIQGKKSVEVTFDRMILENHEWDDMYYDPKLTLHEMTFEPNERWFLSLEQWHELVVPFEGSALPDPILTFVDDSGFNDDEERPFAFRYLDRRFLVPVKATA